MSFLKTHLNETSRAIGLNFAFTLIPSVGSQGQLEGVMVNGETEGHASVELQKESVGAIIESYLKGSHNRSINVSIGNDIIRLIASGTEKDTDRAAMVAGIVGTGYNMAFYLDDNTIINLQASDFTGFKPTSTGKFVDMHSSNRGEQLYNKEVAAGELFKHYDALIKLQSLKAATLHLTAELTLVATKNGQGDREATVALFRHSASLVAA